MEKIYKALLNITTEGIVIHDKGIIVETNIPFVKLFGYNSTEEVIGKKLIDLHFTPETKKQLEKHFNEPESEYESEILTVNKDIISVSIKAITIDIDNKKLRIAVVKDISNRKSTEEKFKMIFDQSPISIVNYSKEGKVLNVNRKTIELFGFGKIENLNKYNLFEDPNLSREDAKALRSGNTAEMIVHFDFNKIKEEKIFPTTKSGVIILKSIIAPVISAGGKITGYNSQLIDITNEYNSQKKIKELKEALEDENSYLKTEIKAVKNFENIITRDSNFLNILHGVEKISNSDAPVLITGETGTGKELIARAIHDLSRRNNEPFICVNCATIPDTLFESELFGHEKGAFTSAISLKKGKFELSNNGTLFLDEIGEIPMSLQPKLLRAIQESCIERIGGTKTIKLNLRIICATNRNLKSEIKKENFRSDLYYRLNVFPVELPPLRERADDIPLLVDFFIDKYNQKYNISVKKVSQKTMKELRAYDWPGNIRELENIIERAVITSKEGKLNISYMLPHEGEKEENIYNLSELERNHIINVLNKTAWRISGKGGAAELLGLPRSTLQSRMEKLKIYKEDYC